ncbi:BRO-N domain-containing protein [Roseospira visakhapatnamensis]|uniref:Prophage antirepressor-like protein n=1 Tax=Roseospira visakhapatnamensis TaxID=390880 RepID=A0A7W6RH18_9PROT|nr:BRO family protein [Roseospira visakhapatnamensis]MBB4268200.1 prophage antirepressor-like protein [Roseospira visakhapatnamensis]
MTTLESFKFEDMEIRGLETDQGPWFVAKDIATALGYANTRKAIADHCKYARSAQTYPIEGVTDRDSLDPQTVLIPEADLYRLIFRSKLPAAAAFEDWVTVEVLPAIRKTGRYEAEPAVPGRQEPGGQHAMMMIPVTEYAALSQQLIRRLNEDIAYKANQRRDDRLAKANSLVAMLFQETDLTDEQIARALVDYAGGYMPEWVAWKRRLWTEAPVS